MYVYMYVGARNRAVHMICIFPLFPYSLPMFNTRRSACIDDRGPAQLWKSKFISLILGKFVAIIPSCFCAVVIPCHSSCVPSSLVSGNQGHHIRLLAFLAGAPHPMMNGTSTAIIMKMM